jgi:phenylpropionate dioxygenase-like ring-hydroxylating dioxygenase large terminal subunit
MADGEPREQRTETRFGQGFLTDCWYVLALARDLRPGRPIRVMLMSEAVMLGRGPGGGLFALSDVCPHRAAPLSRGRLRTDDGVETIECPYHGWRFKTDGACAAIPSLTEDQTMDVSRIQVRCFSVAESQGLIFVWAGLTPASEPDHPPPIFPGVVGGAPKLVDQMVFDAHIDHAVVGLMDPAHGPFVHRQWWWRTAASVHAKQKRFEPREAGFAMLRHTPSRNSRAYAVLGGQPLTEIVFRLPGLRWEHVTVGRRQVLSLTCLTPIDAQRTRVIQAIWSDHPAVSLLRWVLAIAARVFLRQDATMVAMQKPGLAADPALLWIDDADRQAKWYHQLKREWLASRREGRAFVNPVEPATLRWRS